MICLSFSFKLHYIVDLGFLPKYYSWNIKYYTRCFYYYIIVPCKFIKNVNGRCFVNCCSSSVQSE